MRATPLSRIFLATSLCKIEGLYSVFLLIEIADAVVDVL